ncbi:MAG TPA: FecR domain-containing protein [Mycobacterium sp.]|nr:FecR domain-containing protein [Mycobacterium sp.]
MWDPPAATENSAGPSLTEASNCTWRVDSPGAWRIYVTDYKWDDGRTISYYGPYVIGAKRCKGTATEVSNVTTRTSAPTSLGDLVGTNLAPGEPIVADEDVQLDFANGSTFRITKGSIWTLDDCTNASPSILAKEQFSLLLGKLWAHITKAVGSNPSIRINTERVVAGNRGTTFWMSYDRGAKVTAVHVDQGSVWLQRRSRGRPVGKQWIVKAGYTATWGAGTKPVLRRTGGTSTSPTWSFG